MKGQQSVLQSGLFAELSLMRYGVEQSGDCNGSLQTSLFGNILVIVG